MGTRKVGMRDVARRAGVSLSSVSLVVNGTGYVSDRLRERVEQAMRELDYVPNDLARHLSQGSTGLVGVIVPTVMHPFFATLTAALQRDLSARGLRIILCSTADVEGGEAQYVEMLRRHGVDALVVAAHSDYDAGYWTSIGRPVVAFDRWLGDGIPQVSPDHVHAGDLLADLLERTGARRVALVGGPRRQVDGRLVTLSSAQAVTTLERRLDAADIRHDYVEVGSAIDLAAVREAVRGAFDRLGDMDAFIGPDIAAAYAVQEAIARGVAIPEDLQVVAYGGTMVTSTAGLPLTAIRQDFAAIAADLGGRVTALVEGRPIGDAVTPVHLDRGRTTRE